MSDNRARLKEVRTYTGRVDGDWTINLIDTLETLIDDVQARERKFFQDFSASMRDFLQKGETDTSHFPASRQQQIQAKLNDKLRPVVRAAEKGNLQTIFHEDHDLKERLSDEAAMEMKKAKAENREAQTAGRFFAIRNAMDECAKLQEIYLNGISAKISILQEAVKKPDDIGQDITTLLTDLNKTTQNLLEYMHSLEKIKMMLPENSNERLYVTLCENDIKAIYVKLQKSTARLYDNPNVHPQHKETIIKTQEQLEKSYLESRINTYFQGVTRLENDIQACVEELKSVRTDLAGENDFFTKDDLLLKEKQLLRNIAKYENEIEMARISASQIVSMRHLYDGFIEEKPIREILNNFTRQDPLPNLKNQFDKLKQELGITSEMTVVKMIESPALVVYDAKTEKRARETALRDARDANEKNAKESANNMAAEQGEIAVQERRKAEVVAAQAAAQHGQHETQVHKFTVLDHLRKVSEECESEIRQIQAQQKSLKIGITDLQSNPKLLKQIHINSKQAIQLDKQLNKLKGSKSKIDLTINNISHIDAASDNKKPLEKLREEQQALKELLKSDSLKNASPNVVKELKLINRLLSKQIHKLTPSLFSRLFGLEKAADTASHSILPGMKKTR